MKRISLITLTLIMAAFLAACGAPASNTPAANNANAGNTNTAKPVAAAPTKEALMTMERAGWEAWKNRDAKWTEENASDKYVGFGATGKNTVRVGLSISSSPKAPGAPAGQSSIVFPAPP